MVTVLLVEDDQFISDMIETKLTEAGLTVTKTADGASVLSSIRETSPDVVLLDLMLPNKHGFVVLKEIREQPDLAELPVVILSNESGTDVEAKAKQLKAQYFFKAMTDISKLEGIIQAAIAD